MNNNIWIIDPYNEIPKAGWRHGRYYLIAKALSENGYIVNFFISNFSHKEKKFEVLDHININVNFNIFVMPSTEYYNHVSLKRIKYEKNFAKNVNDNKHNLTLPDFVILRDPAIFMFDQLKPLLKKSNAKIVLDIMDLWPELFELKLPKKLRWLGKFIFFPFYLKRKNIIKKASAITAVAPDYLDLGTKINNKIPSEVIYWGCDNSIVDSLLKNKNKNLLAELSLPEKKADIWGIYAGTLGENYDILTLLKAAKAIKHKFPELKILIAGAGPLENLVRDYADVNENIYYLGSLPTEQLYKLFSFCDFGFSTYSDASTVSMPIKCFDYFAAGLPLVNSLNRNLGSLIKQHNIGYQYVASNYQSLIDTLTTLVTNKQDLKDMNRRCKLLSKDFDNDVQYNQFVKLLNALNL